MKMKSKFFGFNAKTALAILAISGSMFTSCYEKEKDDVVLPTVHPVPVYSIIGSFTDANTGNPVIVDASRVTIGGSFIKAVSGTSYSATLISDDLTSGDVTISVTAGGNYNAASASVYVTKLARGQSATYIANIALVPTTIEMDYTAIQIAIENVGEVRKTKTFTTEDGINLTNSGSSYKEVVRDVILDQGATVTKTTSTLAALKTFADGYVDALYPTALSTFEHSYKMPLAPQNGVETITVVTKFAKKTYVFTYGAVIYRVNVESVTGYEFGFTVTPLAVYHGHTHGGSLNAGGGIGDAI